MKRRISVLVALATLISAGTAGLLSTTAAAGETGTRSAYLALFDGENFSGREATFVGTDRDLRDKYWDGTRLVMDNKASSLRNNSPSTVRLWDTGSTCTGSAYSVSPHGQDGSLGAFNDRISCVIFV